MPNKPINLERKIHYWVTPVIIMTFIIYAILNFFLLSNHILVILPTIMVIIFFSIIALLTKKIKLFITDWCGFLATILIFDRMRGLIFTLTLYFHRPIYAQYIIKIERWLLGGGLGPITLQHFFGTNQANSIISLIFLFIYACHFLVFLLLGVVIWFQKHEAFSSYKAAIILVTLIGLVTFTILPTMPPWLAAKHHFIPMLVNPITQSSIHFVGLLNHIFEINPIAAVPSLHAAYAMLAALIGIKHFRTKALWMILIPILIDISCLALAAHYLADLILGNLCALLTFFLVYYSPLQHHFNANKKSLSIRFWNQITLALILIITLLIIGYVDMKLFPHITQSLHHLLSN
jgi:hypothetical protein